MFERICGTWKFRAAILASAGALLLLQAALLPPGAVWTTDNGNKFILLENLLRTGSPVIASPAETIDPDCRFFPDGNFHFQRHDGRIFSIYPEFFSALALPCFWLFGEAGLCFLPICGTLAVLALFLALQPKTGTGWKREAGLVGLLLCGSPLLFYSGTFWEMTLATAFPLAALLAAKGKRFFLAGLLLGAGLWLREEFYLIALAAGASSLFFSVRLNGRMKKEKSLPAGTSTVRIQEIPEGGKEGARRKNAPAEGGAPKRQLPCWKKENLQGKVWERHILFWAGFLLAAIPLWLYNLIHYDHILGLHGALYYTHNEEAIPTLTEQLSGVFDGFYLYYFQFESGYPGAATGWIPLVPMFLLLAAGAGNSTRLKLWAAYFATLSWAFLVWRFWRNPVPAMASGVTVGFVTSSPLLAGLFLMWRDLLTRGARSLRMIMLTALLYCLALPFVLTRSDIGLIWGARHFLLVYPVLFALSFIAFSRLDWLRKQRILTVLLIGISLALQILGIRTLFGVAGDAARAEERISAETPRVVVSDCFFLPEMTPRLFFSKEWLYVKNDRALLTIPSLLREKRIERFLLVLSALPEFRKIGNPALAEFLELAPLASEPYRLQADGSGFMTLLIGECRLQ